MEPTSEYRLDWQEWMEDDLDPSMDYIEELLLHDHKMTCKRPRKLVVKKHQQKEKP